MPEMKSIVLIAGGSVGAAFLDHLLAARNSGLCQISGFLPAGKNQQENLQLRRRAEAAQVNVFAAPEDILQGPETWLGFSAGNSIMLNEAVLQTPENGFINFHAAPLPRFRGSAAPAFAIAEGVEEFGITFHIMVLELDAGPIVLSKSFLIEDDSTAKEIDAQCIHMGAGCFRDHLADFIALKFDEIPNDIDRPAYKRSAMEAYRRLELNWPEQKIWRHVRACDWDGVLEPAYFEVEGRHIFLTTSARGTWL